MNLGQEKLTMADFCGHFYPTLTPQSKLVKDITHNNLKKLTKHFITEYGHEN